MKKAVKYLGCALIILAMCSLASCGTKEAQVIDYLEGKYVIDLDTYAKNQGVDMEDLKGTSGEWTFTKDGSVKVVLTTQLFAKEASDALKTQNVTESTLDYSLSEKIECTLGETEVYSVVDTELIAGHGVVMGTIKSNKTDKKGVTTIKLDTPNGGAKTLKGELSTDGSQFTIDNNENKMSGTYTIKSGSLVADKGVVLGEIKERSVSGSTITLTVTAPDGEKIVYTGAYLPELKLGGTTFSYEYYGDTLVLKNSARSLALKKAE